MSNGVGAVGEKKCLVYILAAVKLYITVSFMVEGGAPTWSSERAENSSHVCGFGAHVSSGATPTSVCITGPS